MRIPVCIFKFIFLWILIFVCGNVNASNRMKHFTTKNGLSDNTIQSIYQDKSGSLWLGTNDGLNVFDGLTFSNSKVSTALNYFPGNVIGDIFETEDNILWVLTDKGLRRLDLMTQDVKTYNEFDTNDKVALSLSNDIYIIKEDNSVYYVNQGDTVFNKASVKGINFESILHTYIDKDNILWIFSDDETHRSYRIESGVSGIVFTPLHFFKHQEALLWCYTENNQAYFVDATLTLYDYDLLTRRKYYVHDLRPEILKYGDVSDIIKYQDDYYVGFASGGLIRINDTQDQKNRFQTEQLTVQGGVLCLVRDKFQDILWVGTDGDGLSMLYKEASTFDGVFTTDIFPAATRPVSAMFYDDKHNLWLGTGGDGVIRAQSYNLTNNSKSKVDQFTTSNSLLGNNSISTLAQSFKDLFWIGSESGLNYYSYQEQRIKSLAVVADGKPVKYIKSICEVNDTTLWIATEKEGIVKILLGGTPNTPIVAKARRFLTSGGESPTFLTCYREDANTIWFGTRGNGAVKVNNNTDQIENITFDKTENPALNNVFSILKTKEGRWLGTGAGLVLIKDGLKTVFNESTGFPFTVIKGIEKGNQNNLWLSTNRGAVTFDIEKRTAYIYQQSEDKAIDEFSYGAYFKDPETNILMFGGNNGFITINENEFEQEEYVPAIRFSGLSIFGKEQNINDYMAGRRNKYLRLDREQNVFSVYFVASDFINGRNYTYYYKLNEESEEWIDNGRINSALFTYLPAGKYTLSVKYRNNVTGRESEVHNLSIRIIAPWYATPLAYIGYLILLCLIIYGVCWFIMWRNRKKQVAWAESVSHTEYYKLHPYKLQFFTNLSNEIFNPLSLILNPCKRILARPELDKDVQMLTSVIQQNAESMTKFMQNVIEYNKVEENGITLRIHPIPVSVITDHVADSFMQQSRAKRINYKIRVRSQIYWNSDMDCFIKIINNLLSGAFQSTSEDGEVMIELTTDSNNLKIIVSHSGEAMSKERVARIFDYNSMIDLLEEQSANGISSRYELLLAISNSLVKLLRGTMHVKNPDKRSTAFEVNLPQTAVNVDEDDVMEYNLPVLNNNIVPVPESKEVEFDSSKTSMLIINQNPYVNWLLKDYFAEEFNITVMEDGDVMEYIQQSYPELIISGTVMNGIDGIGLVEKIKKDPLSSDMLCVLLSSGNDPNEEERAVKSGAEAYIVRPYDMDLINSEIHKILEFKRMQKFYINTVPSFHLEDIHYASDEDRDFIEKMLQIVEENVDNTELSAEFISKEMDCTTQDLYSTLKGAVGKTPNEIIRDYRLNMVERLLVGTNTPIDEIIARSGYSSKSTFLQVFTQIHGVAPKKYRDQERKRIRKNLEIGFAEDE